MRFTSVLLAAAAMALALAAMHSNATAITQAVGFGFQSSGQVGNAGEDFYRLSAPALLNKEEVSFDRFRGKVVLITNVASECGYTSNNYKELVQLKKQFPNDLEIVLVPSNDFGGQEPGTAKEIDQFIRMQGGDEAKTFVVLEKAHVAAGGKQQSELVRWLKRVTQSEQKDISWNFETKFVVSKDGKLVSRYSDSFSPSKLRPTIEYFAKMQPFVPQKVQKN